MPLPKKSPPKGGLQSDEIHVVILPMAVTPVAMAPVPMAATEVEA